jgi:hypothetical protein
VYVIDETPPVLSGCPGDQCQGEIWVECDDIPRPAIVTATDNCDDEVPVELTVVRTDGDCEDEYTLVRTWTATDDCGNTTSCRQIVHVQDETPPVLEGCPEPVTIECDDPIPAVDITATDNCDPDPVVECTREMIPGRCPDEYTLEYTCTATDRCGNTSTCTYYVYVIDETPPVLAGCPEREIWVECDAVPCAAVVTATDNCDDDVAVEFSEERTEGVCEDQYTLTRTWTATDDCGNSASCTQIVHVDDTTPPAITDCPANARYQCWGDVPPADASLVGAIDNCDDLLEKALDSETVNELDPGCEWQIIRVYTVTDNCENVATCTHVIHVLDDTPPVITWCPQDGSVQCLDDLPTAMVDSVEATDNCGIKCRNVIETVVVLQEDCEWEVTRTYTVRDSCGNAASCTQVIHVLDTEAPVVLECPPDVGPLWPDPEVCGVLVGNLQLGMPLAEDNCDDDLTYTTSVGDVIPPGQTSVIWTIEDDCGNSNTECEQLVTVYMWIDIHTRSCPNQLNPNPDGGVMSMTILGCDGFDVGTIDTSTIRLRAAEYPETGIERDYSHGIQYADLTQPPPDWEEECDCGSDLDPDGWTDLEFKVTQSAIVDYLSDLGYPLNGGDIIVMEITAELIDSDEVLVGRDCLFVTPIGGDGPSAAVVKSAKDFRLPKVFGLGQNNPNPLMGATAIKYQLPKKAHCVIKVYDATGRLIRTLVDENVKPGFYTVEWDAKCDRNKDVANGTYFYTMKAADFESTKQMILMRK